jgi:uncharacterized phosphatase
MLPLRPFFFIRHAESLSNQVEIISGSEADVDLSDAGVAQAQSLIDHLPLLSPKPTSVISSTMKRAKRTAEILNTKLGLSFETHPDIFEQHFGDWEGCHWSDILPLLQAEQDPPNGEDFYQFGQRVYKGFSDILTKAQDEYPMIVAHGRVFNSLAWIYGYKFHRVANCSLHLWQPNPANSDFPWEITLYEFDKEGCLTAIPSPNCPSRNNLPRHSKGKSVLSKAA